MGLKEQSAHHEWQKEVIGVREGDVRVVVVVVFGGGPFSLFWEVSLFLSRAAD